MLITYLCADERCSFCDGGPQHGGLELGHTWFPPLASCHFLLSLELSALSGQCVLLEKINRGLEERMPVQ